MSAAGRDDEAPRRHARAVGRRATAPADGPPGGPDARSAHDADAERLLIGAVLLAGGLDRVRGAEDLAGEDLYLPAHRAVFAALATLAEDGTAANLVTVKDTLHAGGTLEVAGGASYLARLLDGLPAVTDVTDWTRIVRRHARTRRVVALAERARVLALRDGDDAARAALPGLVEELRAAVTEPRASAGLDPDALADGVQVAVEGRAIAEAGIPWRVAGLVPALGMLGFLVSYAKVGKTTFGQALGAAVSEEVDFAGHATTKARVLVVAAEDPPEYTAFVARNLVTEPGAMTFYRRPLRLDDAGLARVGVTVREGGYGLVLMSSWQALVAGLVRDENDNAGAVACVERVKGVVRTLGVPFLIDAHAGRGEDQADDADPTKALRGASAAAGAADYILSLRYGDGPFGRVRRLSGKGRFVMVEAEAITFDVESGRYESLGAVKSAAAETTWRQIHETGALDVTPRSVEAIARAAGIVAADEPRVSGAARRRIVAALRDRPGVLRGEIQTRGGRGKMATFRLAETEPL